MRQYRNTDAQRRIPNLQTQMNQQVWVHLRNLALEQTYPREEHEGAGCVQKSIDSRNSAIHGAYRILLRPSSLRKPRHPLIKVVKKFFNKLKKEWLGNC